MTKAEIKKNHFFTVLEVRDNSILVEDNKGEKTVVAKYEDENGVYFLDAQLDKEYLPKTSYHLKNDLGFDKSSIKKAVKTATSDFDKDEIKNREMEVVCELLDRPTQTYTAEEAAELIEAFWTSHNQCVFDNPDDFTGMEYFVVERKWNKINSAIERLATA